MEKRHELEASSSTTRLPCTVDPAGLVATVAWSRMRGMTRACLISLATIVVAGCVERTISITSRPTGALVHLNDEEVGRTPLKVPFTFYGVYDVRLEQAGYQPLLTTAEAKAPWWEAPGPDLLAELLPHNSVNIVWNFEMQPKGEPDDEALIERARQMRALVKEQPSN